MKKCIVNSVIHTGEEEIYGKNLLVEDGIILSISNDRPKGFDLIDLEGWHISAGFIDIQVNGGEKFYFTQTPTEEALEDICSTSLRFGATHILPCIISASHQTILQAIDTVRAFMKKNPAVLGMHLEGPFINVEKRGAHLASFVRKPLMKELEEIIQHGKGVIKVMTIAPELFTDDQIRKIQSSGIQISIGHSMVSCSQAEHYFSRGINMVTHLFNAMTQFAHREPGLVGATLQNENVYAPIILDGKHCDYVAAQVAYKLKKDKMFLISDAAFMGRKMKSFVWGEFNMRLSEDGHYRNADGNLAGASISMAEAVRNAKDHLMVSTDEAIRMATCRVAKAIGCDDRLGYIKPGYPASLVCFDESLDHISPLIL